MTDEYLLNEDFEWDSEDNVDRTPPPAGKHHFAHLRLHGVEVTKSYTAGNYVTIPSVVGGQFNDKDDAGNMQFKGWKAGGKNKLFVLVATKQNQQGQSYQIVKQYSNQRFGRDEKLHLWGDLVLPALKKIPDAQRKKIMSTGLYVEFDELPTGDVFESDEGKKDINYWGNYKVHPDQATLKAAETEFFNRVTTAGSNTTSTSTDHYPATWKSDIQGMITYGKQLHSEEKSPKEIAKAILLVKDGKPVEAIGSGEVNVKQVLSEVLDIPEPMIDLEA